MVETIGALDEVLEVAVRFGRGAVILDHESPAPGVDGQEVGNFAVAGAFLKHGLEGRNGRNADVDDLRRIRHIGRRHILDTFLGIEVIGTGTLDDRQVDRDGGADGVEAGVEFSFGDVDAVDIDRQLASFPPDEKDQWRIVFRRATEGALLLFACFGLGSNSFDSFTDRQRHQLQGGELRRDAELLDEGIAVIELVRGVETNLEAQGFLLDGNDLFSSQFFEVLKFLMIVAQRFSSSQTGAATPATSAGAWVTLLLRISLLLHTAELRTGLRKRQAAAPGDLHRIELENDRQRRRRRIRRWFRRCLSRTVFHEGAVQDFGCVVHTYE